MVDNTTTSDTGKEPVPDKPTTVNDAVTLEGDAMDRFVRSFEASARRWELVIYPTMLAFVILAGYGFFLIYTLSRDIHTLALGMDPDMGMHLNDISSSVAYLSENIRTMTRRVDKMTHHMDDISVKMNALEALDPMLHSMQSINGAVNSMALTTDALRAEMTVMGRNISRPMSKINSFMPW